MQSSRPTSRVIGCDIGGANLKLADTDGKCVARAFPMWLKYQQLATTMAEMLSEFEIGPDTHLAVTMTGELADCFATRREGVHHILKQVEQTFVPKRVHVYAVGNLWMSINQAAEAPWSVAASNWHALATWIGSSIAPSSDLVLDIGSTTVDIIPLHQPDDDLAYPATQARTDRDRLGLGQLVYTGLERTPVAAIVREVSLEGNECPIMAERFATSDDCYVVLGLTPESPNDFDTADNRSRTISNAHARLARMVGEDAETLTLEVTKQIAQEVIDAQASQIASAMMRNLPMRPARIVVVGHGRPLAQLALAKLAYPPSQVTWLADHWSPAIARSAPAFAVARLLHDALFTPQS